MAEEKYQNVVRISDEALAAVKREATWKEVGTGQAATMMIMKGESRKRALQKYYGRVKSGKVVPTSRAERAKTQAKVTRVKERTVRAEKLKAAEKSAKRPKTPKSVPPPALAETATFEVGGSVH